MSIRFTFRLLVVILIATCAQGALFTEASCDARIGGVTVSQQKSGTGSASVRCVASDRSGTAIGEASAYASYNLLEATAFGTSDDFGDAGGTVSARFEDTLTVLGSGSGILRLQYGSYDLGVRDGGYGTARFSLGAYTLEVVANWETVGGIEADVPIQFGVPFQITGSLQGGGSSASGDFTGLVGMSLRMGEMWVLGSDGVPLTGYRYVAASNHDYSFIDGTRVPVPEPASVHLVILSVACVALLRRSRFVKRLRQ